MAGAKKKIKKKPIGGPFLAAAIFCDTIVEGADHALSAIRIIDKVSVAIPSEAPTSVPSESLMLPVAIWTLLMFKSGGAKGEHELQLVIHSPSGKRTPAQKQKIMLSDSPSGGVNIKTQMGIGVSEGGLYMVDVLLDGKRMTRMPLDISVKREEVTPSKPARKRAQRAKSKPKRKRG